MRVVVVLLVALIAVVGLGHAQTCNNVIYARSFTATGGLDGIRQSSAKAYQPGWGSVQVFRKNLCESSGGVWNNAKSTCQGTDCIDLVRDTDGACRRAVVGNPDRACGNVASLDSAGDRLDRAAGEIFNSVAFTDYPTYMDWLLDGSATVESGLEQLRDYVENGHGGKNFLDNAIRVDRRNTHYVPVSAGFAQSSGLFAQDLADLEIHEVCEQPARWRYLPPSQYLWQNACARLEATGVIAAGTTALDFIVASEGGSGVLMHRLRQGYDLGSPGLSGLEFAAVEDNCPTCVDETSSVTRFGQKLERDPLGNAGHNGARFVHYPAFHQPGFILWLFIAKDCDVVGDGSSGFPFRDYNTTGVNGDSDPRTHLLGSNPEAKNTCWNQFTDDQKQIIEDAAKKSVREAYLESEVMQCHFLKKLDTRNDDEVQLNVVPFAAENGNFFNCGGNNNVPASSPALTAAPLKACLRVDPVNPYVTCDGTPTAVKAEACSADFKITTVSDNILEALEFEHDQRRLAKDIPILSADSTEFRKSNHLCLDELTDMNNQVTHVRSIEQCQTILDSLYTFIEDRNGGVLPTYNKDALFPNTCPQFKGMTAHGSSQFWDSADEQ